jgi:DNA-binding NarL/FixJ family response regulator
LLEAEPDHKVIGQTSDGAEAVKLVRQLKPDILILDLVMPKHFGMEVLRELSSHANPTPVRVIALTAAIEKSQIVEALQLGARGVVLTDSGANIVKSHTNDHRRWVPGASRTGFEPGAEVYADEEARWW